MALGTADAAVGDKLQGSAGAGYQYEMKTSQVLTDAQSLSTAISGGSYWTSFTGTGAGTSYADDIAPHVNGQKTTLSGTTYTAFTSKYSGTGIKAGIADYIDAAIVSSDFQDLNPQTIPPRGTPCRDQTLNPQLIRPTNFHRSLDPPLEVPSRSRRRPPR